ncbi:hypothetical protein [Algisphaera agarilytica]|uniref:Uncharacterized protein n=1 Tax=Algisphaera agarilytica TaxID=1385975 RepID=A0A7X0H4N7_9BACT|nr:hypothetical protein [Algisphaera agarilytica]MBB6429218.1 hypothetical protein [Algisphaera agarilytica]
MTKTVRHKRGGIWNQHAVIDTTEEDIADRGVPEEAYRVLGEQTRTSDLKPGRTTTKKTTKKKASKKKPNR